jgi:hypothetical protein
MDTCFFIKLRYCSGGYDESVSRGVIRFPRHSAWMTHLAELRTRRL